MVIFFRPAKIILLSSSETLNNQCLTKTRVFRCALPLKLVKVRMILCSVPDIRGICVVLSDSGTYTEPEEDETTPVKHVLCGDPKDVFQTETVQLSYLK